MVRTLPDAPCVQAARDALRQSLTAENIVQEAAYLRGGGRASFERPYGLAWLLQLAAELKEWDDPQGKEMGANLHPLEEVPKMGLGCRAGMLSISCSGETGVGAELHEVLMFKLKL